MRILRYEIEHHAAYPWQLVQGRVCHLRLRTGEALQSAAVLYGDPFWFSGAEKQPVLARSEMQPALRCSGDQYYSVSVPMRTHKLRYHFVLTLEDGDTVYLSELGVTPPLPESVLRPFNVPYVYAGDHPAPPEWAEGFLWYQIFPDRFCDGKENQGGEDFIPTRENFFGGTLQGITGKIPYLRELGVQGIYLNPIFRSDSNHRYDTVSYTELDPRLGGKTGFRILVETLHQAGMRIMLDGVFNHCGWRHPFWQDVRLRGKASRYYNWFCVYDAGELSRLPLEQLSDRRMKEAPPYECFAFAANMPKWNTENPEVIRYLVSIAEQWTREYGIDAWRLDVPDEVSLRFLHAFRTRMRSCNAAVYVIGEIWQDAGWWLEQSVFDGVMDYPLYHAIRDFAMAHTDPLETFAHRIRRWYAATPEAVHPYQWAFCSNHDVPRALSLCGGNKSDFRLAYVLAALLGGNLSVYYGDEIAMDGGQDPDNRRPMRWTDPEEEIRGFFHSLLWLKRDVLRHCRLTAMELTDALYLHFDGPGYGILAVITERGQAVTPQLDASDSLLLEAPEGHAAEGTVQGFAVFRREVTHDGNT